MQRSSERKNEVQKNSSQDCEEDREERNAKDYQFRIVMKTIMKVLYAIDGRFGKKVLKPKYRKIWQCITYGTLSWLFIRYVMFPFFDWWDGVVDFLNYVIWG
jgi:hypothetical protein